MVYFCKDWFLLEAYMYPDLLKPFLHCIVRPEECVFTETYTVPGMRTLS